MDLRAVRRSCDAVLDRLDVPHPFDVTLFVQAVARHRGRGVILIARDGPTGPCGMWLALPDRDYIFYDAGASALHRDHIVLHELGHLACRHAPGRVLDPTVLQGLLPSLDPVTVAGVMGRTSYSEVEEQEAEVFASLVLERSTRTPTGQAPDQSTVLGRLDAMLGGRS